MQYTALPTAPAGFTSAHRLYDTLMQRIDLDLVTWNFTGFKMSLLTLSPKEQQAQVDAKQASLMRYRKQLVQLESSISHPEDEPTRALMQAGGDLDALARIENEIHTL